MNHSLIVDVVKVDLHDETNEGWYGDFDPDDPDDEPLLRFDISVLVNGEWQEVDNASYCTQLPATIDQTMVDAALKTIMNEVHDAVVGGWSIKKTCECLSWLQPSDFVGG